MDIETTISKRASDYLKEYSKDYGLTIGQVIDRLVLNAQPAHIDEIVPFVFSYIESLTGNYTAKQKEQAIIHTTAYLLSYIVDIDFSFEQAIQNVTDIYNRITL